MPRAFKLMQAIVGPDGDEAVARRLLEDALLTDVDPLLHAAFSLNIDINTALERAAVSLGLAYFETVPAGSRSAGSLRLERLADVHFVRATTLGEEVAYAAPDFNGLMRLGAVNDTDPALTRRLCIVPSAALRQYLASVAAPDLLVAARQALVRNWPTATAGLELTLAVRIGFAAAVMLLVVTLLALPFLAAAWLMPVWATIMLLPALVRLTAFFMPNRATAPEERVDAQDLPIYSVLVPLRDEAEMVEQLSRVLGGLDYPGHRLDIIFVVEQRSPKTVEAVRRHLGNARFSLVEVPHSMPLTKPKALDFALPFCRGEFVVVFDAEDRPEPGQLRQVVNQFRRAPHLHCIQARLVIANGGKGGLPALFAGEYAALFSVFLPALGRWGVVMPLGGTSNHFRLASLRAVGGWDAYNVTEDADLGVRLARRGFACGTSSAATLEDAPETLKIWMGQRRRWMKGWMQTVIVHSRHPRQLIRDLGWWRFVIFEIVALGMILSPLLHTGFLLVCMGAMVMGHLELLRLDLWTVSCLSVFVLGYGIAFALQILGLIRTGQARLIPIQILLPVYWIAMAWATLRALLDLTLKPFHWIKTVHRPVSDTRRRQVAAE
ncbi:glycosyltransferase [Devosia sp.]|uniref:glycosyltransferase family 2 protein n=1 Tax=Devosia sp. TaxID=1871048 RepID=UPI001AD5483D|nr:glycosyltransferase [Devosia sp.]MBN9333890.1 glycosyltransferase [Devosia sp.]